MQGYLQKVLFVDDLLENLKALHEQIRVNEGLVYCKVQIQMLL